jgi:hypothetical protein
LGMDVDLQFGAGVFPRECQDLRNSISPLTTLSLSLSLPLPLSLSPSLSAICSSITQPVRHAAITITFLTVMTDTPRFFSLSCGQLLEHHHPSIQNRDVLRKHRGGVQARGGQQQRTTSQPDFPLMPSDPSFKALPSLSKLGISSDGMILLPPLTVEPLLGSAPLGAAPSLTAAAGVSSCGAVAAASATAAAAALPSTFTPAPLLLPVFAAPAGISGCGGGPQRGPSIAVRITTSLAFCLRDLPLTVEPLPWVAPPDQPTPPMMITPPQSGFDLVFYTDCQFPEWDGFLEVNGLRFLVKSSSQSGSLLAQHSYQQHHQESCLPRDVALILPRSPPQTLERFA